MSVDEDKKVVLHTSEHKSCSSNVAQLLKFPLIMTQEAITIFIYHLGRLVAHEMGHFSIGKYYMPDVLMDMHIFGLPGDSKIFEIGALKIYSRDLWSAYTNVPHSITAQKINDPQFLMFYLAGVTFAVVYTTLFLKIFDRKFIYPKRLFEQNYIQFCIQLITTGCILADQVVDMITGLLPFKALGSDGYYTWKKLVDMGIFDRRFLLNVSKYVESMLYDLKIALPVQKPVLLLSTVLISTTLIALNVGNNIGYKRIVTLPMRSLELLVQQPKSSVTGAVIQCAISSAKKVAGQVANLFRRLCPRPHAE